MRKLLLFLLICLRLSAFAQIKQVGTPYISNYIKTDYNAGRQNWAIIQDKNEIMYFANNNGVLMFDGQHWKTIPVSSSSPVRSINVDENGTIYIGLYNDFGKLVTNNDGELAYQSLVDLLPDQLADIDDIWKIHIMPYGVVFQSFRGAFIYKNESIDVILPNDKFHFSFKVGNRLFLHEPKIGLFELINESLLKVSWDSALTNKEVWSILPFKDNSLIIGTQGNGLYKYEDGALKPFISEINDFLIKNKLFSASKIDAETFAYGTILNGVVFADAQGKIIQHINKDKGLGNNTILCSYLDKNKNIWLGLDNGIDYVEINSPISLISDYENIGTGYCAQIFEGNLYLGTNQGVFVKPYNPLKYDNSPFYLIKNTVGQVWTLNVIDGYLLCGHNTGTYEISGREAKQISSQPGAWTFVHSKQNSDYIISGNYNGLVSFKQTQYGWKEHTVVEGFNESSRFIYEDERGSFWISHGAKGVMHLTLNDTFDKVTQYKLYNSKNGLPTDEQNIVLKTKDKIFVSNYNGLYRWDNQNDAFIPDTEMTQLFDLEGWLKKVKEDKKGNIWYISDGETGVLRLNEDLSYTKIYKPFQRLNALMVNAFENIFPYNDSDVYIGIDNGFVHYSSQVPKSYNNEFPVYISSVDVSYLDFIIPFHEVIDKNRYFEFPYLKNAFRFNYNATFYEDLRGLEFSYLMKGYDDKWSEWSKDTYKDFTNLHEGEYEFLVKAKNVYGAETVSAPFVFKINSPWFRSVKAYTGYAALLIIIIGIISMLIIRRVERIKRKQLAEYEQEMERQKEDYHHQAMIAEKEIVRLRNEKLRSEMIHRDKELANQTMGIIQKDKLLNRILNDLQAIHSAIKDEMAKVKIQSLKKQILKELDDKQQKKIFETYFDEVHEEFFRKLKEKFPHLTPNDLRMCAFIRMNISTKEISTMLNISYRGTEISRYRLRKKLDLSRDINLSTFLTNI